MVKKSNETVEEVMKKQLSLLENSDKMAKLEKELFRDKKIIQELKEREKVSARALVIFERKLKFLKEIITNDLLKLCKYTDIEDDFLNEQDKTDIINDINEKLYEICNKLSKEATVSSSDKNYILNKSVDEDQKLDTQSRFNRLKANFNEKIGESVLRKPGRPKKEEQSIVADLGLGKKVEKVVDSEAETHMRLTNIFYGKPTSKNSAISTIPQTEDSTFDFAEALNPEQSLKDIMADIMGDGSLQEDAIVYNKENIDSFISKNDINQVKTLEDGIIKKPKMHKFEELEVTEKKSSYAHKNGILMSDSFLVNIKNKNGK